MIDGANYPYYSSVVTLLEVDSVEYEGTVTSEVSINFEDITICFGGYPSNSSSS
jgi:hypothetical protein